MAVSWRMPDIIPHQSRKSTRSVSPLPRQRFRPWTQAKRRLREKGTPDEQLERVDRWLDSIVNKTRL